MTRRIVILVMLLCAASCGRRVIVDHTAPPSPEPFYNEGLAAFHQGTPESYAHAADAFRRALDLKPERCEYALNLAQSLLFLASEQLLNSEEYAPRQAEAATIVDSAALRCTPSHESFVLRLRALIAGRGPTAIEPANRAVDLDPEDAMNWVVLGYLDPTSNHLVTADGAGRWVAMTHAVGIKPDSALIQYEFGKNYQSSRRPENEARDAFQYAIERSPRHFRAYLNLAYVAGENTDVEALYEKIVEIAPGFIEGRIAAGSYYAAVDEIEKAAQQYSAVLAINPRNDVAEFRLGLLMLQAERPAEAGKHFERVVELNPGSFEAWYQLGNISYGRNSLDQAKEQYEQAVAIRTNYAEAEFGIGRIYSRQNLLDMALVQFDKTIRMQPRNPDAYAARADIRLDQRHFAEALADYQKAIEACQELIQSLNQTIVSLDARGASRVAQAEKNRAVRDKARTESLLAMVRQRKSQLENAIQQIR